MMPPSPPTAAELGRWALALGFDLAAVAGVEPIEHGAALIRWLERGDHAGMDYMADQVEERLEPARVLEGARSVLCVALRYHPLEGEAEPTGDLWPKVARYARGRDYHNKMGKLLRKLARRIREEIPGCETRTYVDTGPVLERALAVRAGLGATGKNTCLLTRNGSYLFLGEIFLTAELSPTEPAPMAGGELVTDLCGRCTLCLEACPTDALPEPYRLDANRCIAYWTIEHRGAVPRELRPDIGEWVFGCDICQEVCPWNRRRTEPAAHEDLRLAKTRAGLDLVGLLLLGANEYSERFNGSAMQRARREGLQRNAATAMGNRRDERYVPALTSALEAEDGHESVRCHAAWALGRIGGRAAEAALEGALAASAAGQGEGDTLAAELRWALEEVRGRTAGDSAP
ncbi:MAG: tRNA epoxyqueuosine(34) reductase QueG [Acidobacteria bacterium]|nr:tRNA epoxyqueuosine(34) reductase QueG [Acidobacteriota bacterium]